MVLRESILLDEISQKRLLRECINQWKKTMRSNLSKIINNPFLFLISKIYSYWFVMFIFIFFGINLFKKNRMLNVYNIFFSIRLVSTIMRSIKVNCYLLHLAKSWAINKFIFMVCNHIIIKNIKNCKQCLI